MLTQAALRTEMEPICAELSVLRTQQAAMASELQLLRDSSSAETDPRIAVQLAEWDLMRADERLLNTWQAAAFLGRSANGSARTSTRSASPKARRTAQPLFFQFADVKRYVRRERSPGSQPATGSIPTAEYLVRPKRRCRPVAQPPHDANRRPR